MNNVTGRQILGFTPEKAPQLTFGEKPVTHEGIPGQFGGTTDELVALHRPAHPVYLLWPERVAEAVRRFRAAMPGEGMYAVKANTDPRVIRAVYENGIRTFDAASIEEIRLVRQVAPAARICFMHPVKTPEAIAEAYHRHGVRTFVLDYPDELAKILRETGHATDLDLVVRLRLPRNASAAIDFSAKFGALPESAKSLLQACRPVARGLGISFHVGTQSADPEAYAVAIHVAADVIRESGVSVDSLNIGGGFPVAYIHHTPPPIEYYMQVVKRALKETGLEHMPLVSEPGRYLVAGAGALLVRVEQRRGDALYINDGTYGGLFDAGPLLNMRFPVRAIRPDVVKNPVRDGLKSYRFVGPTCDSLDMMEGPFDLPANMKEGQWIEISMLGAYSAVLRSNFNGFGLSHVVHMEEAMSARLPTPNPRKQAKTNIKRSKNNGKSTDHRGGRGRQRGGEEVCHEPGRVQEHSPCLAHAGEMPGRTG